MAVTGSLEIEMHALSPSTLLEVWEKGMNQPAVQQALMLLSAAFPETPPVALAERSIGQRNALLLTLREWLFGAQFVSLATCPQCGESLELNFETADVRAVPVTEFPQTLTVKAADYEVHFRLPNSVDLAHVGGAGDAAAVERMLLLRCLIEVQHAGEAILIEALPGEVAEAVVETMDRADPQANIELSLTCQACAHQWQAILDILTYVWRELDNWARRVLREVHALASAYGWSEHDILNMRPWRRQIYMEMIRR